MSLFPTFVVVVFNDSGICLFIYFITSIILNNCISTSVFTQLGCVCVNLMCTNMANFN